MANTLIIGKDLPDSLDFSEALTTTGRTVFGAAKSDADTASFEAESIFSSVWNKSSAISAHSLLIKAETKMNVIDEVVFYFDANYFCSKFELDKTDEVAAAVDMMINPYLYMANELLSRADQRREKMTVAFVLREYPSKTEVVNNSSKYPNTLPAPAIVSSAAAAFEALAENFATCVSDREYLSVMLAKCAFTNELYKNERGIAGWVAESFDTIKGMKNHQTVKQATVWNKAGAKIQTGFLIFK